MSAIETSKALDLIWFGWKSVGIYPIQKYTIRHSLHMLVAFVITNIFTIVAFVTQLFFVTDWKDLLDNLQMNVLVIACVVKFTAVFLMRRKLLGINDLLTQLDRRPMTFDQAANLTSLVKFCKRFFAWGFFCYEAVDIMAAVDAAFSKQQKLLYEIWLPFDWRASATVYWLTFICQLCSQSMLALQSASSDLGGPIYLVILRAHLENIMIRIESLKHDPKDSEDKSYKELINCIKDHRVVIKIFDVLQGTVSHIIFFQFMATALVLVMIALNYLMFSLNVTELITLGFFFCAEMVEILPCCYYSDQFLSTTDRIVTSLYSCDWYNQSPEFKKTVIIFMQMTQRGKLIVAGKIIPATMSTFASIIKSSYSLLTVVQGVRR